MRVGLLLLMLTSLTSGQQSPPGASGAVDSSDFGIPGLLSMDRVSMTVVEAPAPAENGEQLQDLERANIDGFKMNSSQLHDAIVDLIAAEMKKAGITSQDIKDFIENSSGNGTQGNQDASGFDNNATDMHNSDDDEPDAQEPSEGTKQDDNAADDQMGAARPANLLRAVNPSAGTVDVFQNGTDFFKWLDDILEDVADRVSTVGNSGDPTAEKERPAIMDGQVHRDDSKQNQRFDSKRTSGPRNNYEISNNYKAGSDKSFDSIGNTWNAAGSNRQRKGRLLTASFGPHPPNGFDGWKKSEIKNGGFDAIPKAVPMIVMSGNTYIKDIGNFRNNYSYNGNVYGNPADVRTVEPNGNDSGVDVDASNSAAPSHGTRKHLLKAKRDGNIRHLLSMLALIHGHNDGEKGDNEGMSRNHNDGNDSGIDVDASNSAAPSHGTRKHLLKAKRDGNIRHLLSMLALIHGHNDGEKGDNEGMSRSHDDGNRRWDPRFNDEEPRPKNDGGRHWDPRFDDEPRSNNDGGRRWDSRFDDGPSRHDDGNTYHSDVHGHDDGDSRGLLRSPAGNTHGHDDGNTYNPTVHGHDDPASRSGGSSGDVHGHDDGNTYNPTVHGHDDPASPKGGSSGDVHGHDDGNTYNPTVHGHDDPGSRSGGSSGDVHGHDDGNTYNPTVHGHDSSGSRSGGSHDDGNTYNPTVHGHDDGAPSRARSGPLQSYWRHDDGGTDENHHERHNKHDDGGTHEKHDDGQSLLRATKPTSMTMTGISLTAVGCAVAGVLLVAVVVVARRRRAGLFRRQDYVEV